MELKEFINKTLTQIAEGVQEAIDNSEGKGYLVSPTVSGIGKSCNVHFDIAVESEAEGKAGIKGLEDVYRNGVPTVSRLM